MTNSTHLTTLAALHAIAAVWALLRGDFAIAALDGLIAVEHWRHRHGPPAPPAAGSPN